jgi:hypothetical protein
MTYAGSPEEMLALFISDVPTNYGRWPNTAYDALYHKLLGGKAKKPKNKSH